MEIKEINTLKPRDKRYKLNLDEKGVYVRVGTNGSVSVYYRYSVDTKNYDMKLGIYPEDSIQEITDEFEDASRDRRRGKNPKVDKELKEVEKKKKLDELSRRRTFGQVAQEYLQYKEDQGKIAERTLKDYTGVINREIMEDPIRNQPIEELWITDLEDLKMKVRKTKGPAAAGNLHRQLTAVFKFGVRKKYVQFNIATALEMEGDEAPERDRYLEDDEIRLVWNNLHIIGSPVREEAIRYCLLTGQRPIEVAKMHTSQVHDGWWVLSGAQVKTNKRHRVWLTRPIKGDGWVFPAPTQTGHVREDQLGKDFHKVVLHTKMDQGEDETPVLYDLRRTLITNVSAAIDPELAHRMTNHNRKKENVSKDKIDRIYNKHHPEEEKKEAWSWWADRVRKITLDDNVVPFRQKSA